MILPKGLPMPAIKGGAIEKLVNDIIDENEEKNKLDITVTSIYDEKAEEISKKYKHTQFLYIKNDMKYKMKALYVRIMNLFGKDLNTYNEVVLDNIKNEGYDLIVVEDGAYQKFKNYLKYFNKKQMILHSHHNAKSTKSTDEVFNKYIGVSQFVANDFKATSEIENIEILKNGVQINNFDKEITDEEIQEIRNKIGIKKDDFAVIFCGRLIPEKGVMELVKAVKQSKIASIKLVIIGSINFGNSGTSEYFENLKKEIDSSNGKIVFTGFINNNDLYKYYKSGNLGVVSSTCKEAAPLTVIEMMMCKLPIIVTRVGGIPEYISNEVISVPNDDKLIESLQREIEGLYYNKMKREKMSNNEYMYSKQFTTEQFYNNFVQILNKTKEENKN